MNVQTIQMLRSTQGVAALAEAEKLQPTTTRFPACLDLLRKHYPDELARAALDIVLLRPKAQVKFEKAHAMLFDREGLEMATSELVSQYRAIRFKSFNKVADLCCGIGGDAISLAQRVQELHLVDQNPLRLAMAEANLAAYSVTAHSHQADCLDFPLDDFDAVFADPNRRDGARRHLDPAEYSPSVPELLKHLNGKPKLVGIKIAPGVDEQDWRKFNTETEFISLNGELKEAVLWFGEATINCTRATVLPGPHVLQGEQPEPPVGDLHEYILDPDPAVVRAKQLGTLSVLVDGHLLDEQGSLLTCFNRYKGPFARCYQLEEPMPFHVRKVQERLTAQRVGRVTLIQRGSGLDAEKLQKQLKLKGDSHRVLILTRIGSQAMALICRDAE